MRKAALGSLIALVTVLAAGALGWLGLMWWDSRLPGTYNVMDHGQVDLGGGSVISHAQHGSPLRGVSVAGLHGPRDGKPDASFTLTAQLATIELASGRLVQALTYEGRSPGPELRVRQGDLVEVTLENRDITQGVTIHWHGLDVPNAEDGVAGVTQDAVSPGERYVYRFRAEQVGTFWYHTHQASSKEVRRGLFGAIVIEPAAPMQFGLDRVVLAHTFDGIPTLDGNEGIDRLDVPAGTRARLRLVNSDNSPHRFALTGAPFGVVALDGTDLNGPHELSDTMLEVPGGGRIDVALTVPASPVWLSLMDTGAALALNAGQDAVPVVSPALPVFDPTSYGEPVATPFDASTEFDRRFELTISERPGFFNGRPGMHWAINGQIFPHVPTFLVEEGELVEIEISNETDAHHPMHLHGHHVLVLSRGDRPVSGSPWWADTLDVGPGERYRVAFRADNPGLWMDHCHNLRHAADGLTMHVAYAGVTTPFDVGGEHDNAPE